MAGIDGYKEKYLNALSEQEALEKKYAAQIELLKKALVSLSVAAKGQETKLDASLIALQNSLRGGSGSQVFDNIERLQRVVGQFDNERTLELKQTSQSFIQFIDNLQSLSLPSQVSDKLTSYKRSVKKHITSYRSFGEAIKTLSQYQQDALQAAADPNMPLWQRVKKGRSLIKQGLERSRVESDELNASKLTQAPTTHETENIESVNVPQDVSVSNEFQASFTDINEQDNYPKVAKRINETLKNLVKSIEPSDIVRRKIEIVLDRIERGMDWFSLAVTLEDTRDILMVRYLNADKEFSHYLKNLNLELGSISEALGVAQAKGEANSSDARLFSDAVSNQMDKMQKTVEQSESLGGLQVAVDEHIKIIRESLNTFKGAEVSNELSLSQQLNILLERVKSVEEESEKSRIQLEEQRYKATHDPLTELPNREAYTERAFHELHRFKRYGHPLTLAICDIDFFKKINDNFGHQAGDKVLKLVAKCVSTRLREVDFVARYGGEEFVLIMPETTSENAFVVLDKIRAAICKTSFRFKQSPLTITMSFGIKQFEPDDSVESAFEKADKALYDAKNSGRNQCVIAP